MYGRCIAPLLKITPKEKFLSHFGTDIRAFHVFHACFYWPFTEEVSRMGTYFSRFVLLLYVAFSTLVLSVLAHRASANLSNKNDTKVYKLVFSADERLAVKPDDG